MLGGLIGLFAALLVAYDARRREERSAAMLLIADLTSVIAMKDAILEHIERENLGEEQHPSHVTDRLKRARHKLSPLFEASMSKIMPVDDQLSAHLTLFKTTYGGIFEMVEEMVNHDEVFMKTGNRLIPKQTINMQKPLIHNGLLKSCEHASCAEQLLDMYVVGKNVFFNRLGKRLGIKKHNKDCRELLKSG